MKQKQKFLAAKVALIVMATSMSAQAGIPVIDAGNLTQNIMTAMESVAHTTKQIQQYQKQLQEYENMLQNTLAPSAYIWDHAQVTINNLVEATNTLEYYKKNLGSIDEYMAKFQDVNYYKSSPCFSSDGCSEAEQAKIEQNWALASESQKKANDAVFKGLDQQQTNLQNDAATLEQLQANAQGATGQMAAIGYANQLASQQANQLLQIRGLLIAQNNAVTTRMQAQADKEAQQAAAAAQFRRGSFKASPARSWKGDIR